MGYKRSLLGFTFFGLLISMQPIDAFAFANEKITRSVGSGGTVHIRNFMSYALNPCRSMPTPTVDPRTPSLGKIEAQLVDLKYSNGPCGKDFKYQALRVSYKAGSQPGLDTFTLFLHDGFKFIPIPIEVKVSSTNSVSMTRFNEPRRVESEISSRSGVFPKENSNKRSIIGGRYVNNHGNISEIEGDMLHFTGYWNKEKVHKKPFVIIRKSGKEFEWSDYRCSGEPTSFRCTHSRTGQENIYKKLR